MVGSKPTSIVVVSSSSGEYFSLGAADTQCIQGKRRLRYNDSTAEIGQSEEEVTRDFFSRLFYCGKKKPTLLACIMFHP